ncbi:MAG TPA: phosphatase PAP2 family protein [Candidatus Kapabacteria bacterium]|nr:phosphatase PAP2 family protein [Candidatus Kapabacteria bacterium]
MKRYFKDIYRNNRIFLIPYFLLFLAGLIFFISNKNDELLFYFNSNRTIFLNYYFIFSTDLLSGIGIIVLLLIALSHKYSTFFKIGVSTLITFLIVELIKGITDLPRPSTFFANNPKLILNPIKNISLIPMHSFPSGHAANAFAIFFGFSIILKNQFAKVVCLFIACSIAISRVYLLQHFTRDILFGSLFGIIITSIVFFIFDNYIFINKSAWYNKSIFSNLIKYERTVI